jgi:hypothetical protein
MINFQKAGKLTGNQNGEFKKLIKYTLLLEKDLIKPWQRYYNSHIDVKIFVFFSTVL